MQELCMIRDLPLEERPRERFLSVGAKALSNAELLAIILRNGTPKESALHLAQRVLSAEGGLQALNHLTIEELTKIKGIGPNKAIVVLAAAELGKRISQAHLVKLAKISSPEECVSFLLPQMKHLQQEHFIVIFLDTKNNIIGQKTIFIGSLNRAVVHPREVFCEAIKRSSASIICAHNHPSGDPSPSEQDITLTHRLSEAGSVIGISLLDHLIIGSENFISLKGRGYI